MRSEVVERFQFKFDELNNVKDLIIAAPSKEEAVDMFEDVLIDAYIEGFVGAGLLLGRPLGEMDEKAMKRAIEKEYQGETIYQRMAEHYNEQSADGVKTLLDSEFHRVYTQAQFDRAKELGAKKKTWRGVMDDKERDTHRYLEGVTIDIDADFITYDGDRASAPGGFFKAQNNANCRCILDFTA